MFGFSFKGLLNNLGSVGFMGVGTSSGTACAGDDSRVVDSLHKKNNLNEFASPLVALANINGFPLRGDIGDNNLDKMGAVDKVGFWSQKAVKGTSLGYPTDFAGTVLIMQAGNVSTTQLLIHYDTGEMWRRAWNGSRWSVWKRQLTGNNNLSDVVSPWDSLVNLGGFPDQGGLNTKDLNTILGTWGYGVWRQNGSANATKERNYPIQSAGSLLVFRNEANSSDGCTQVYMDYNISSYCFTRVYRQSSKTWSPWVNFLFSQDNLQTLHDGYKACKNLGIYNRIYPIGSVTIFDNATNPNSAFPGTIWSEIRNDRVFRSSPDGSIKDIGEDSFVLTEANIPKHSHTISGSLTSNGNHTHWDGWNAPGNSIWDEKLPNESEWDAALRLTGRGLETSGTNNQGTHNRRRTSLAGSHSHNMSFTCSYVYAQNPQAVYSPISSKRYRTWKRTA